MKPRPFFIGISLTTSVAMLGAVAIQRLHVTDLRQTREIAGGVLAGEASELERVLARLQHEVAIAAVDCGCVAGDEHAGR